MLRAKHQKMILKEIGLDVQWKDLTVGMLWGVDLKSRMKVIKAILEQAQGNTFCLLCCSITQARDVLFLI